MNLYYLDIHKCKTTIMITSLKLLCVTLLFLINNTNGQRDAKFFRKDYTFIDTTQSFYKIHTFPRDWQNAKTTCEREGAILFYPDDDSEAEAVLKYVKENQPDISHFYVGISALFTKGVFETVDGLSVLNVYHKWGSGEPNDVGGIEDCVILRQDGTLNDFACHNHIPFVCTKPLASLQWNSGCNIPDLDYKYNEKLDRCYKFHLQPRNWTEAYAICSAEQSYLAVIDTQAEADHLVRMTEEAPKDTIVGNYLRGAVQLGFQNRNDEGWRTIKNVPLEKSGYSNWGYAQPDGSDKEKCGSMFYNGQLNDLGCHHKCFFICEHDPFIDNSIPDFRSAY